MRVIFPPVQHSESVRAVRQGMTVKRRTAKEVDQADKGQTSQQKLKINGLAGYAHSQTPAHTRISANTHCCSLMPRSTYVVPVREDLRKTYRQTY